MSELRIGTLAGLAIALGRAFGRARADGTLSEVNRVRLMRLIEDEAAEAYCAVATPPKPTVERRRPTRG